MTQDITKIFNKFAGKEVQVKETSWTVDAGGGKTEILKANMLVENEPTIQAMQKLADDKGLTLRILWPNSGMTDDVQTNRINVHVVKEQDGKYRIGKKFTVG